MSGWDWHFSDSWDALGSLMREAEASRQEMVMIPSPQLEIPQTSVAQTEAIVKADARRMKGPRK